MQQSTAILYAEQVRLRGALEELERTRQMATSE